MGLAGRKVKQRIPNDPRNLSWADDAARFGSNYLAKFGWHASKGLGAEGEGRLSHIRVTQKLDMMGIGAAHQNDPNGIAWKQNRDFENLLKRLNENSDTQTTTIDDFKKEDGGKEEAAEDLGAPTEGEKKKKKRKDKDGGENESEHKKKKRKKEEVAEEQKTEVVVVGSTMDVDQAVDDKVVTVVEVKKPVVPRHRAHRARAIAAKNISSKSAIHISEILGIAPTPTSYPSTSNFELEQGKLTSLTDTEGQLELEKITTSTKSLADYFKEKLASKSSGSATPTAFTPSTPADADDAYDTPRVGLGSFRAKVEVQTEAVTVDEATQRMGLSKFSALMSSTFLASTSLQSTFTCTSANVEDVAPHAEAEEESETRTKKEKKKKEKKVKGHVEEEDIGIEKKEKKHKKSKKGKDKEVESEVEEPATVDEEKAAKKKKKKEKKQKAGELPNKNAAEGPESSNSDENAPDESRKEKEEKRKSKSETSEATEVDKSKKKKRRTSDDDS